LGSARSATVDWDVARQVAARFASRDPFAGYAAAEPLEEQFGEYTARAEELVAATTGLPRLAGDARARVTDRHGWVEANVRSFQRMLRPLTERLEGRAAGKRLSPISRKAAGVEAGALLGWMSGRVLGQYDLLIVEDEQPDEQDIVYFVGSNIVALERRYAFDPEDFRMWIALHECTHRAQFTGVPWLRPHFLGLVEELLSSVEPDSARLRNGLRSALAEARRGGKPLDAGGLAAVVATPRQREIIDRIGGLMSLLEGHGDVVMNRAGVGVVTDSDRFERVLKARRNSAKGLTRLLQKLTGIEAKLAQYAQGERFIGEVEAAGGLELFDRVWRGPQWLPTLEEIRAPAEWIARVQLSEAVGD